jgi:hypothetical protein
MGRIKTVLAIICEALNQMVNQRKRLRQETKALITLASLCSSSFAA